MSQLTYEQIADAIAELPQFDKPCSIWVKINSDR